jgi:hypothetical protein
MTNMSLKIVRDNRVFDNNRVHINRVSVCFFHKTWTEFTCLRDNSLSESSIHFEIVFFMNLSDTIAKKKLVFNARGIKRGP